MAGNEDPFWLVNANCLPFFPQRAMRFRLCLQSFLSSHVLDPTHGAWRGTGLINSGDEWHRTIEEAAAFQTGNRLLFVFVCIFSAELLPGWSPQLETVRRPSTSSIGRLQSSVLTIKYYRISFQWPCQVPCLEFRPRFTSEKQLGPRSAPPSSPGA
jgi:hypothetical protein